MKTANLIAALVALGFGCQNLCAQVTVTVRNSQGMGMRYDFATGAASQSGNTDPWKAYARNAAGTNYPATSGAVGKIWLQFDLSGVWQSYGKDNLLEAYLVLWGENGPGRQFDVSGLRDDAGLENWDAATLSWANAPANDPLGGYHLDWSKIYGGGPLWQMRSPNTGVDLAPPSGHPLYGNSTYDQCARYTSPEISAFLKTDTDGKVTFILTGSPINNNQNWWIGPAGSYDTGYPYRVPDPYTGDVMRDSPTLLLTFVPEPNSIALAGLGLIGVVLLLRRTARPE